MRTPQPTVTIDHAPLVAQPEDTVVLRLPRRTAEVLRTVLNFIGGPNGDGEPRTRLDQLHFALIQADVKSAAPHLVVSACTAFDGRWPIGMRLGWKMGASLVPPASKTGGIVTDWPSETRDGLTLAASLQRAETHTSAPTVLSLGQVGRGVDTLAGPSEQTAGPRPTDTAMDAQCKDAGTDARRTDAANTKIDADVANRRVAQGARLMSMLSLLTALERLSTRPRI